MNDIENYWYALFVETGEEDKVKERLEFRFKGNIKVLVPKRRLKERKLGKWQYVIRKMFPSYVLVNGFIGSDEYYQLKNIPGLYKLIRSGKEIVPIDEYEMDVVNKLTINSETIEFSSVLMKDGKVIVVDGPLMNLDGLIESVDLRKGRAKVRLNFMGEARTVELGIKLLQPV